MSTREVLLEGLSPWGFRMTGGADATLSLRISRVNPGSKAAAKGVREGDLITSINRQPTKGLTNQESHALLRTVKENLLLGLNQDPDASPKRKGHKDKQAPVESLPPQLPADTTSSKGDKMTTSKLRRERRRRLRSRIKGIFGLGKRGDKEDGTDSEYCEGSAEGSERSLATRNEDINSECRSEGTSAMFSEDNSSLIYDNDSTNEQIERAVEDARVASEREVKKQSHEEYEEKIKSKESENREKYSSVRNDLKPSASYSEVFVTCNEYLMGKDRKGRDGQELDSVPPDIILSSNRYNSNAMENTVSRQSEETKININDGRGRINRSEDVRVVQGSNRANDLNNNKSGDRGAGAICSTDNRVSVKRVHIFHSPDECKIDEMRPDNSDRKQSGGESVECIPERTVNLCKAIVSFEDGGESGIDANSKTDKPFILLEDDASLLPNSPSMNSDRAKEKNTFDDIDISRILSGPLPMYYIPVRRYLDVIKEEPSDISDGERSKESSQTGGKNQDSTCAPDDWHLDGIDTSWRDGKSLDDVSDVPVASDSLSDTDLLIDDTKPPKGLSSNEQRKIANKQKIYQTSHLIVKPPHTRNKVPSINIVKSVVASYYTNKSKAVTIENVNGNNQVVSEQILVCPSVIQQPSIGDDVEVVYIDSSDSDAISIRSEHMVNSSSSNRSSIEFVEEEAIDVKSPCKLIDEQSTFNNLNRNEVVVQVHDIPSTSIDTSLQRKKKNNSDKKTQSDSEKYAEEMIELSQTIISEIAETLSSGPNSRLNSARSTPCKLIPAPNSFLKEPSQTKTVGPGSTKKETNIKEEIQILQDSSKSSTSSPSTAKCVIKQIPSLKQLSSEVIFELPNGKTVLRQLGFDSQNNYDSGSDYFPETSEYSEPSRLSFTSTDEVYGVRSHKEIPQNETDQEPASSAASSIVFINRPGKVSVEPWIGMPLTEDPRFIVCFSPSQLKSNYNAIDQQKASELLDLHNKFIQRRGYHENFEFKTHEPDLISVEMNNVNEKDRYAPEILSEAANLLALHEYHKNRQNKMRTEDKLSDVEDNRVVEEKELNLGCSGGDDRMGRSKCKSEHNEEVGSSRLLELIQKEEVKSSTSPERSMLVEKSTTGPPVQQAELPSFDSEEYNISKKGDIAIRKPKKPSDSERDRPKSLPPSGEIFRRIMYEEYMDKVAERMERRQMKLIKVSDSLSGTEVGSEKGKHLEAEFMNRVRERMEKLGLKEDENDNISDNQDEEGNPSDNLPKHLQEFVEILNEETGVWSPAGTPEAERKKFDFSEEAIKKDDDRETKEDEEAGSVVWTPRSAGASPQLDRKKYRPINFQSPPPHRKEYKKQVTEDDPELPKELPIRIVSSSSENSTLSNQTSKLPPAQNPVITLLQKAREGQLPKGAQYLEKVETKTERITEATVGQNEIIYSVKKEYESDSEDKKKKIIELTPRKFEGIGPTTKEGTPIALRSEVKEDNQQRWYKRMYDSLHKADHENLLPYTSWSGSGYLSEPDRLCYDSDASLTSKYATLDRRRAKSTRDTSADYITSTVPRNSRYTPAVRHAVNVYRNQPGRIEDYEPGYSSIADKEKQQWLDEVMDIFDGEFKSHARSDSNTFPITSSTPGKSFTSVFKETGYDSDSTLIFRRKEGGDLPLEDKMAYQIIQRGGDVPLHGLRKPAPNKPKEPARPRNYVPAYTPSPEGGREYIESEVNIHYKTPVRVEHKEYIEEDELARRQAEALRRIYQQQRRNKYLAELNDIHSRRHQDYFTPSQKSPIPLNRYDDFPVEVAPPRPRDRTPEPKLVARALYNFLGQSSRELSFRRGDIIFVRRQIDKNWYEGEHNAMIGLFPINYVEIIPYDGIRTLPKKSTEGQARAKFNFQAQTHLELSLVKGELVLLTRRVDENWFEGRIGNKKGIFPVSYVQVLVEPGEVTYGGGKPVVAPASHSVMLNGAKDIGSQMQPPRPPSVGSPIMTKEASQISQLLHIDTRSDPVPYRAMYNYKPQNDDELELREGDVVYVMEKCDDGWYVGSLHRNGQFGTFPGNYVQRIP